MIANRIANASQVRFRSDSHPNRPTRPDPTRPFYQSPIHDRNWRQSTDSLDIVDNSSERPSASWMSGYAARVGGR